MSFLDHFRNAKARVQKFVEPIYPKAFVAKAKAVDSKIAVKEIQESMIKIKDSFASVNPMGTVKKKIISFEEMLKRAFEPHKPKDVEIVQEASKTQEEIVHVEAPKKLNFAENIALAFAPFYKEKAQDPIIQAQLNTVHKPVSFASMLIGAFSPFKAVKTNIEESAKQQDVSIADLVMPQLEAKPISINAQSQHFPQEEANIASEKIVTENSVSFHDESYHDVSYHDESSYKESNQENTQSQQSQHVSDVVLSEVSQSENVSPFLAQILNKQKKIMKVVQERADKGEVIPAEINKKEEDIFTCLKAKIDERPIDTKESNPKVFDENNDFDLEERADNFRAENQIKIDMAINNLIEGPERLAFIDNVMKVVIRENAANAHLIEDVVKHYEDRLKLDLRLTTVELDEIQEIHVANGIVDAANRAQSVIVNGLNTHALDKACQALKVNMIEKLQHNLDLTKALSDADLTGEIFQVLADNQLANTVAEIVNNDIQLILNQEDRFLNHQPIMPANDKIFCQQNIAMLENNLALEKNLMKNIFEANNIEIAEMVAPKFNKANPLVIDTLAKGLAAHRAKAKLGESDDDSDQDDWDQDDIRQLVAIEDVIDMGGNGIKGLEVHDNYVDLIHPAFSLAAENTVCAAPAPVSSVEMHLEAPIVNCFG